MTPTPTPSQVKTGLKDFSTDQKRHEELKRSKQEFLKYWLFLVNNSGTNRRGKRGRRVQSVTNPL